MSIPATYALPLSLALALALPLGTTSALVAADNSGNNSASILVKDDITFIEEANQCGLLLIKESELVLKRKAPGLNQEFAQKMVTGHQAVKKELGELAARKGVMLSDTLNEDMQKKYDALAKTDDAKLGKKYLEHQVKEHKNAVDVFDNATGDSKDPELKVFAVKHLPHLQAHLDEVKRMEDAQ